jgi:integrase
MSDNIRAHAKVIKFESKVSTKKTCRKGGINKNKNGSVRNINGKVYVDFMYLGQRLREASGLKWTIENEKEVRKMLDKIMVQIESHEFRFADVFPDSPKKEFYTELEHLLLGRNRNPNQILFKDYIWDWYNLRKKSEGISSRTLGGYKGYIEKYLIPFFGERSFGNFNKNLFDEFIEWAKEQKYRDKAVGNESISTGQSRI